MEKIEDKLKYHNMKFTILQVHLGHFLEPGQLYLVMDLLEDLWDKSQEISERRFLNMNKLEEHHQEVVKEARDLLYHTKTKDINHLKTIKTIMLLNLFYQSNKINRICMEQHLIQVEVNTTSQSNKHTVKVVLEQNSGDDKY